MNYEIRIPEHLVYPLELYSLESHFSPEELILLAVHNLLAQRQQERHLAFTEPEIEMHWRN